jgi:hypothetical protein
MLFMEGEYSESSTLTIAFKKGLSKGDYLILYQSEFSDLHEVRKLVLSVYCEDLTSLKLLNTIPDNLHCEINAALKDRL